MNKVTVIATYLMVDHDGYCSGAECELSNVERTFTLDVNEELRSHITAGLALNTFDFATSYKTVIPEITFHDHGSLFCRHSPETAATGLTEHEGKLLSIVLACDAKEHVTQYTENPV